MQQPWIVVRPARFPLSFRIDRCVPPVLLVAVLATLALMTINIGVGEYPIAPLDVIKTVFGIPTANPTTSLLSTPCGCRGC